MATSTYRIPRLPVFIIIVAAFIWWTSDILSSQTVTPGFDSSTRERNELKVFSDATPHPRGIPQHLTVADHEVIYELHPRIPPQAILLLAHGCSHSAGDFWPPSEHCPGCLGLPEEVHIATTALRKGWVPVAVSSADRTRKCWDTNPDVSQSADLPAFPKIVEAIVQREGLVGLPVFALGASSGGALVLMLPRVLPQVKGICAQIMGINPAYLTAPGSKYPPTVFVHMPRDTRTAAVVAENIQTLTLAGTKVVELQIDAQPVTATFLKSHARDIIDEKTAQTIIKTLKQAALLQSDGWLKSDPRQNVNQWREKVFTALGKSISVVPDESPITELMNVAWANHEIVSQHVDAILEWMAGRGQLDMQRLIDGCLETEEKDCMR